MGFFKNLFSTKENIKIIHELRQFDYKQQDYFIKEIEKTNNIILNYEKNIAHMIKEGTIRSFNYWSISMKHLRKVYLNYSLGKQVSSITDDYTKALEYYIQGWDEKEATYADMIAMVTLGILLEVSDTAIEQLITYVTKTDENPKLEDWTPDYLLRYLLAYRNTSISVPESVLIPSMYQQLVDLTKLNKEEAQHQMKKYLDNWYGLHKNDPWYNNHKRQSGYKGYWCWEAAAVVKVMGLDDSSFKDHPHYPYDMVHWKDNETV